MFDLSCSLAKFYQFDLWKVYMTHVKYLMTDNEIIGLSIDDVGKKNCTIDEFVKNTTK